jgi:hypothetical protein
MLNFFRFKIECQNCEGFSHGKDFGCILRSKNKTAGLVTFEKASVMAFVSKKIAKA